MVERKIPLLVQSMRISTPDYYHDEYSDGRWFKTSDGGSGTYRDGEIAGKSYDLLHGFTTKTMDTFKH